MDNVYKNEGYKLRMNIKLYHGQNKWYAKEPIVGDRITFGQYLSTFHDLSIAEKYADGENTS